MRNKIRFCVCVFVVSAISLVVNAQVTMQNLPYFCGFESESDYADWTIDTNPATNNRWIVGTEDAYDGSHSFYISENSSTAIYQQRANVTLAFFEVRLAAGNYDFAFDWKGLGNRNNAFLRVFLTRQTKSEIRSLTGNIEPAWYTAAGKSKPLCGERDILYGSQDWRHVQTQFTIAKSWENADDPDMELYVVFEWCNTDITQAVDINANSIKLDNIQLAKSSTVGYPQNPHVDYISGSSNIYWENTSADKYLIKYRWLLQPDSKWEDTESLTSPLSLTNVQFGPYEMWIRTIAGQDTSVYTYFRPLYIYDTDCFDALNMYNATFETGNWDRSSRYNVEYNKVDYGYLSDTSRHTTHYLTDEYDKLTIGTKDASGRAIALKTVPEGSVGSVRLGNWETGSEYENITFKYTVSSLQYSVLLLQYAMVLQDIDHVEEDQPRFFIDVLDENGNSVDVKCGQVDFHTPTKNERQDADYMKLWHKNEILGTWWQDWRAVGLNLNNLLGQTLTITLTTYDCDQSGHFGYAYFTLQCISSEMEGIPWGETSSTTYFTAPNGFNYKWYRKENYFEADGVTPRADTDPQKVAISNTNPPVPYVNPANQLNVDQNDPADYICEIIYPTNSECNYTMEATARPHTPKAEIQWEWVPKNCQNEIIVKNASHIVLTNRTTGETEDRYDMQLPIALWTLPDGTQTDELNYEGWHIPCSNDGEQLKYYIRSSIWVHNKEWADSLLFVIDVPPIGDVDSMLYDTVCEGTPFYWKDIERNYKVTNHNDSTFEFLYTDEKAWTGCDSTVHMMLFVNATRYVTAHDTICDGHSYLFGEGTDTTTYYNSVQVSKLFHCKQTGCDSVVKLNLFKLPVFTATPQSRIICADGDYITIDMTDAQFVDKYVITVPQAGDFSFPARQTNPEIELPLQMFRPAHYDALVDVYTPFCDPQQLTISFDVNFSSDIVRAKWDNVLAILNEKYNGGYTFSSFQWYKDGQPIKGATGSWYHTDDAMPLQAEYSVDVVLTDGTPLKICPFIYESKFEEKENNKNNTRKIIENGCLYIIVDGCKYNIYGLKIE